MKKNDSRKFRDTAPLSKRFDILKYGQEIHLQTKAS
jgi:hypothetical protein